MIHPPHWCFASALGVHQPEARRRSVLLLPAKDREEHFGKRLPGFLFPQNRAVQSQWPRIGATLQAAGAEILAARSAKLLLELLRPHETRYRLLQDLRRQRSPTEASPGLQDWGW